METFDSKYIHLIIYFYTYVMCEIQVPYIVLASLSFTLPFFFIVGFQHVGNQTVKFFWYWLFQGLLTFVMVYFGQFFAALCPSPQSAQGTRTVLYLHHTISRHILLNHSTLLQYSTLQYAITQLDNAPHQTKPWSGEIVLLC